MVFPLFEFMNKDRIIITFHSYDAIVVVNGLVCVMILSVLFLVIRFELIELGAANRTDPVFAQFIESGA